MFAAGPAGLALDCGGPWRGGGWLAVVRNRLARVWCPGHDSPHFCHPGPRARAPGAQMIRLASWTTM
eukprot:gene19006-biopygen22005